MEENTGWIPFYEAMADALLPYKQKRQELIDIVIDAFDEIKIPLPKLDSVPRPVDIDPFTVMGLFNKKITDENRALIMQALAKRLGVEMPAPEGYVVPVLNNLNATFYRFADDVDRGEHDLDNLWDLFEKALIYADDSNGVARAAFCDAFDAVKDLKGNKFKTTMALYWIRPYFYLSLEANTRELLTENAKVSKRIAADIPSKNAYRAPSGSEYAAICELIREEINDDELEFTSIPDIVYKAWLASKNPVAQNPGEGSLVVDGPGHEQPGGEGAEGLAPYGEEDFLHKVFIGKSEFEKLTRVLRKSKNLILQGAPGTGKTFAARRLAYAMMGVKDDARIELVQFHQNYSYEDFVMGYKPQGDTFVLKNGVFFEFCQRAAARPSEEFFFIVDEINRGNMSKIFGELLMLIEASHRGEEATLAYSGERFAVPANLYLIGMMNTADRSLAMIDYALRRRFAFYQMVPAFEEPGFKAALSGVMTPQLEALLATVEELNAAIERDPSLGKGFCLGHSYFCGLAAGSPQELDDLVHLELVPLLEEYWFDEPEAVANWTGCLESALA